MVTPLLFPHLQCFFPSFPCMPSVTTKANTALHVHTNDLLLFWVGVWSWIFPGEERQTLSELVKDHSCASGLIYSPLLSRMLFTGRRPDVLTRLLALTCCQDVLQTNVCMCLSLSWGPAHKRPLMSLHLSGKDVIMRTRECYWGVNTVYTHKDLIVL